MRKTQQSIERETSESEEEKLGERDELKAKGETILGWM